MKTFYLTVAQSFLNHSTAMVFFLYPLLLKDWGFSIWNISITIGILDIVVVGVRPLIKIFMDRYGAKSGLVVSSAVTCLGTGLIWYAQDDFALVLISRCIHGAGLSLFLVANAVYFSHILEGENEIRGFSIAGTAVTAPPLFTAPLCEWLILSGKQWGFFFMAFIMPLMALFIIFVLPDKKSKHLDNRKPEKSGMLGPIENPQYRDILVASLTQNLTAAIAQSFLAVLAAGRGILTSFFFVPYSLVTLTERAFLGFILEKIHPWKGLFVFMMFILVGVAGASFSYTSTALAIFAIIYGIGQGFLDPLCFALVSRICKDKNAGFTGYMTAQDIGWAAGPFIAGSAGSFGGIITAYYLVIGICATGTAYLGFRIFGMKKQTEVRS